MAIRWKSSRDHREIGADGAMLLRVEDGLGEEEEKRVRVLFHGSVLCCEMWADTAGTGMTLAGWLMHMLSEGKMFRMRH